MNAASTMPSRPPVQTGGPGRYSSRHSDAPARCSSPSSRWRSSPSSSRCSGPDSFTLDRLGLKSTEFMTLALVATGQTIVGPAGRHRPVRGRHHQPHDRDRGQPAETRPASLPWMLHPALGIGIGLVNGLIISVLRLQPFVVTLATWSIIEGVALLVLPSEAATVPGRLDARAVHSDARGLPISVSCCCSACSPGGCGSGGTRSPTGVRAAGSNERSAFLNGVSPHGSQPRCVWALGVFRGARRPVFAAKTGSGTRSSARDYILPSIAAVVIGGTSLHRWPGRPRRHHRGRLHPQLHRRRGVPAPAAELLAAGRYRD